ncbi:MAG: hypothetical protein AB7S26_20740 [Sandaracinaceae bacterium]
MGLLLACLLGLHVLASTLGCGHAQAVQGYARVASVDGRMAITMCETTRRYRVGVATSSAAMAMGEALERARSVGESFVYIVGYEETSPSGARVDPPTLAQGSVRVMTDRPDGC